MVAYLGTLTLISSGASIFALTAILSLLQARRLTSYDARGFYLLVIVFSTFFIASLAYFWGEMRFHPVSEVVSESLVGVLFSMSCSLACLAYGLYRLKGSIQP